MTEPHAAVPSSSPHRLGRSLLMTLAAGVLAGLAVACWPRSGEIRPPGTYLVAGGIECVVIGPGRSRFPMSGNALPAVSGYTWEAFGGKESLILEGRTAGRFSSAAPGRDEIIVFEFSPSRSRPGDYDLQLVRHEQRRSNPVLAFLERVINSRRALPSKPAAPPVPGYLHRLDDPKVEEYFRIVSGEPPLSPMIGHAAVPTTESAAAILAPPGPRSAELLALAGRLVDSHPADLHVRILLLDSLIRGRDQVALEKKLAAWKKDFADAAASDPTLGAAFAAAERQARGLALSARGANAYETLVRALSPITGLKEQHALMAPLSSAEDLIPPQPLTAPGDQLMNFLCAQISAKVGVVEVLFRLLQGSQDQARGLAVSLYRCGQLIEEHDTHLITRLIGIALRSISASALQTVALNSPTPSDLEALGRELERLAAHERPTEEVAFTDSSSVPLPVDPSGSGPNSEEAKIRHRVSNVKFALVRTANAARHRLLVDGRWPDPARKDDLAPLLTDGVPVDPFSPTSAPLSLAHDPTSDTLIVYSVGPDGKDDGGFLDYSPRNGTLSGGDIVIRIPRERQYPFPEGGVRASSAAELARRFPKGLPADPFADTSGKGLSIAQTTGPVCVYSFGPDTDEVEVMRRGASYVPETPYDPTNGIVSVGDLFLPLPAP